MTTKPVRRTRWDEGQFDRPEREGDLRLEKQGMAPIPPGGRYRGKHRIFTVWFSPNLVPAAFFTGTLVTASYIGLSFWWAVVGIVFGNLIGSVPVGLLATMGPRTGMAQLPLARVAFGKTIPVPGIVNWASTIAWDGVNGLFGAEALALIFHVPFWAGLAIVIAAQGVLAVFGYEVIHTFQKWMSIVLALVFVILTVKIATVGDVRFHAQTHGAAAVGGFVLMVTIVASFVLAWSAYASDCTRYMAPSPRAGRCSGGPSLASRYFLLFISYWIAPFAGVVFVDWWRRKGRVDTASLLEFAGLDLGWQALTALLVGFAVSVPFMDSSLYVGPVSSGPLHGGDIAYYVGFVVAAGLYGALRPRLSPAPRAEDTLGVGSARALPGTPGTLEAELAGALGDESQS